MDEAGNMVSFLHKTISIAETLEESSTFPIWSICQLHYWKEIIQIFWRPMVSMFGDSTFEYFWTKCAWAEE
jgi:hypothetical protein